MMLRQWLRTRTRVTDDLGQEIAIMPRRARVPKFLFVLVAVVFVSASAFALWLIVRMTLAVIRTPGSMKVLLIPAQSLVGMLCGWCGMLVMIHRVSGQSQRLKVRTAGSRLALGLCGSCLYPLRHIIPEKDGHSVCPECGAAWQLDLWQRDWARRTCPEAESKYTGFSPRTPLRRDLRGWKRVRELYVPGALWGLVPGLAGATILGALFVIPWYALSSLAPTSVPQSVLRQLFVFFVVYFLVMLVSTGIFAGARSIVKTHLHRGQCPHCAQRLRATPAHGDGAHICDECGWAWKDFRPAYRVDVPLEHQAP
jgi:hypothetical protein